MITSQHTSTFAGLLAVALFTSVASAQNVGIGTTTPKSKLSVNGTTASGGMAIGDATYTSTTGIVAPVNGAIVQGRVGVGTTNPLMRMHLEGDGSTNLDTALYINSNAPSPVLNNAPQVLLRATNHAGVAANSIVGRFLVQTPGTAPNNTGMDIVYRGTSGTEGLSAIALRTVGSTGSIERVRITETGEVGVGTDDPVAPLHVLPSTGSFTRGAGSVHNFIDTGESLTNGNAAANLPAMSIYANGRIVSGSGVFAEIFQAASNFTASDRRIKNVTGLSDPAKDLDTLGKLRITDYTMKDTTFLGDKPFKKVIAQEVEEVFPQAVSKTTKAIPDVMQRCVAKEVSEGVFTLSLAKDSGLQPGERVEIFNKDRTPEVAGIKAVEGNSITVALSHVKQGEEVMVYGRQVNDFGIVDYEALSMLTISATQELARKVAALEAENAKLKADNAALSGVAADVKALKEAISVLQTKGAAEPLPVALAK